MTCGCERGVKLCPEARRLWRIVGDEYARTCAAGRYREHTASWASYDAAREAYEAHFETQ